jgi:hypothetical protein
MAIDGARIQRVTGEGLFYLDDAGEEQFIDFAACHEQDLTEYLRHEHSPERIEKRKTVWRYVAARDIMGHAFLRDIPCIQFYTDPPTLFEFEAKDAFNHIRYAIEKVGWRTYDLS